MIVVDIIIALTLIFVAWKSFSKGIIMQLTGFFALVIGIMAAYFFWDKLYNLLQGWMNANPYLLKTIAVVGTIVVVALVIWIIGKGISKAVKISLLGIFDRILGMCFGIAQGLLLMSFILFALNYINPNMKFLQDETLSKSYILPYIKPMAPFFINWMSKFL